jgi:predicted GNAT superfamily acetyltransferase
MSAVIVRRCETLEEFHGCVALEREIWGEEDLEVEPVTTFVIAARTGGQVLGAYDGPTLVGFTLALAAIRNGAAFLHSHMTGVRATHRDRGVGRLLKISQREEALGRDLHLIEWTFDPLEMRNAHFNLNRLGAICRCYLPDLYGVTTSPLHRGLPTDRLLAEWHLDSLRVIAALKDHPIAFPCSKTIEVPASQIEHGDATPEVHQIQARIREQFQQAFGKGHAALAVNKTATGSAYLLAPWSEFQAHEN